MKIIERIKDMVDTAMILWEALRGEKKETDKFDK